MSPNFFVVRDARRPSPFMELDIEGRALGFHPENTNDRNGTDIIGSDRSFVVVTDVILDSDHLTSSSGIGPKTGAAMSRESVRLQYGFNP